jgi:cytochrome c556
MELPKDATKNFEKAFDKISRDMAEFEIVAARGISSLADTKNVEKAWKQITKDLDGIGATLGSLDASKVFPKEVLQNIEKANGALDKYLAKLESTKKS